MNPPTDRRFFLFALGALGIVQGVPTYDSAQAIKLNGFVLGPADGEHLIHFRDHGNIFIKISSDNLAVGTQQVMRGSGIPVHRHLHMDEAFCVLEGSGTVTLNDASHSFEKGASIFIPRNTWQGFANPDQELLLLWMMSPAGLDGFFRETCSPPGAPAKQLSRDQIREIARKYGTEFR
jgi:quercetin dioxygenase-like cupin family protein